MLPSVAQKVEEGGRSSHRRGADGDPSIVWSTLCSQEMQPRYFQRRGELKGET